ncbi:MAG: hypothetical protein ASARMPRED_005467 [Alectoria sarmentosa]|nr:MAG: hypothetical protein ASARMPRED_005467 [Alectoria sarmentosa]
MRTQRLTYGWASILLIVLINFFPETCRTSQIAGSLLRERAAPQLPATPFFLFPNGDQPENIRPRLSGQLLVTLNTSPLLYQIHPFHNQTGGIVHRFEGYTSLFGIVETQTDLFYIIASNFTGPPDYYGYEGSVSVFQVDLRGIPEPTVAQSAVKVSKVVDIPEAQLLDGFALVNQSAGLMMTGDAQTGTLYLINVQKRTATAVLQDALLNGTATDPAASLAHVGINGIKFSDSDLYFTNTAKGTYGKVPLDTDTGEPAGSPSILANYGTFTDDFSFDGHGNQFISEPLNGILLRPANTTSTNNQSRLVTRLSGANSNAFGRTALDLCILYATFNGAPSGIARVDAGKEGFCNTAKVEPVWHRCLQSERASTKAARLSWCT